MKKSLQLNRTTLAIFILGVVLGGVTVYALSDHHSYAKDPRCDPLWIKNVRNGQRNCNDAREQGLYLDHMKHPNSY